MNTELLFSSKTNEWATPMDFFNKLNAEFNFTLDPASTHDNAKCLKHFTEFENGLIQSWKGEKVFCNPPYGREIGEWVKKAYEESTKEPYNTICVLLIPARTDTQYWHDYVMKAHEIRFIKGRLKFGDSANSAPFPSAVVIFRPPVLRSF